ncbi:MAG: hypothetical protein IKE75_02325 [Bacilli bacterium]|nr:hypothetical protein [Bacilli bacterium]
MKYLLKVLVILIAILFGLKLLIHIFDNGHKTEYTMGNFNIKETLKVKQNNNYYFEIKSDNIEMNFQINKNYNKASNVITKLMYKETPNYKCILPVFKKGEILTDIMCLKDNIVTYYHNIESKEVDTFAKELAKVGYDKNDFKDSASPRNISSRETIYDENINSNHYIAYENYKGLTLINGTIKNVKIFNNDVYTKQVSLFTDKYYIVADYNAEYTFKKFYIINLINGNIREIRSYDEISFDSIIQGAVGDDVYIFDKDSETQYKLSLKYETVEKIQNEIKYYNGKWGTMALNDALNGKKFDNYFSNDINGYDKVNKVGNYYYLYKKQNDNYLVYRADIKNPKLITYIFKTDDINSVYYLKNYVYYKNETSFNYYSPKGSRKIINNKEIDFNKDISFGAYIK